MKTPLSLALAVGCALSATFPALAQSTPSPIGFAPPELTLSDFNSRELHPGDFNNDGKDDLISINSNRGRLDFFIQSTGEDPKPTPVLRKERWEPVLSHPRFDRESLIPDSPVLSLEVGDFNGDGIEDFVITDEQKKVHIYHGPMKTGWKPFQQLDTEAASNSTGSMLWDDEHDALYLLGDEHLEQLTWSASKKTYVIEKVGSPPKGESPGNLMLIDVDGNGEKDVVYSLRTPRYNLAVHLRSDDGLGNLLRPPMDPPADEFTILPGEEPQLLALHQRSKALLTYSFSPPEDKKLSPETGPDIRFIHIPQMQTPQFIWTDLDEENGLDLVLISKSKPEIHYSLARKDNVYGEMKSQPIPVACSWMVEGNFTKSGQQPEFVIHDPDTGYLGITRYTDGRIQIPEMIPNTLSIIGAATWQVKGESTSRIVGIVRDQSRKYHVKVWSVGEEDGQPSLTVIQETPLPDVKRDPGIPVFIRQSGEPGEFFMVASPLSDAFFLIPDEDQNLVVQPTAEGFSTSLLKRKRGSDFFTVPQKSPFPSEWIHLNDNSVQFLKMNPAGQVDVVDQINMSQSGTLSGILPLDPKGSELALLDTNQRRLEIHKKMKNGTYEYVRDIQIPPLQPLESQLFGTRKSGYHLRIQGRDQITLIFPRAPQTQVTSATLYETDLPNTFPRKIIPGDFNGDTELDIALIDTVNQHTIEFLEHREDRWVSTLHFQLFDTSPGAAGRRGANQEPREVLVTDINADGLNDMVFLIHDRIMVYIQDPVPEQE